jgi:serine/threonine protein kinase
MEPQDQRFSDISKCGSGSFATIYSAVDAVTGVKVALKLFHSDPNCLDLTDESNDMLSSEISIQRSLDHPGVARFLGVVEIEASHGFIMEFVDGKDLFELLVDRGRFSECDAQPLFLQVIGAVHYLHLSKGVIHRDLKLENVMVSSNGTVKLIDFGFALRRGELDDSACGSAAYLAPEAFQAQPPGESLDIWSLGVMLYAMICGCFPFGAALEDVIVNALDSDPEFPHYLSDDVIDLMTKMLRKNPAQRIDIEEVRCHRWLRRVRRSISN